ncbi:putative P-loop containing nucleoside triphosphate hydrolase, leucine-rich repeat domain superfamily [Helianthus annuus]|nr:putative P-loop containing nucleoside triphosphate hydrolase, leucine-rich repeat domain superfamily [Helianthus annuus]
MIGIKGMGGGGKTTLPRAVFDHISNWFDGKSFVGNVKEDSKRSSSGLRKPQKQILKNVLNDDDIDVAGVSDVKSKMKKYMGSKKVLIVLDDVDDIGQLEALAGDEAICLFSRYAFGREIPNQGYRELSGKVVHYDAGLLLTIKVLGSHLCGRSKNEWVDALERLKTIPLKETLEKLELSYNGLEDDQKEIFLDIACILKGETKKNAIRILESCGFRAQIGLRVLEQKSLITISMVVYDDDNDDQDEMLHLHDHIEEMGRNIVRRLHPDDPKRHSRLWIKEEIEDILVNESGTKATRSIILKNTDLHTSIVIKGLRNMTELRFLYVNSGYGGWNVDAVSQYLPDALQSLNWCGYPFQSLPKMFRAYKLVNLEMSLSNISQLLEGGERKVLNKLRFLDLRFSKLGTLDLGMTPNLEMLHLEGCQEFAELRMHVEYPKLKFLNLSGSMVSTFNLGLTPHLETLNLRDCNNFVDLHMPVKCPNLEFLDLIGSKVSYLNLGMTPHLKTLCIGGCNKYVELHMPNECPNLEILVLNDSKVSNFDLGMTPHLKWLNLEECKNLVELHMPFECPKLKFLSLRGSKVHNFNLGLTPNLKRLDLGRCKEFVELHMPVECPKLKFLDLSGSKVTNLNLGLTPYLEVLNLKECFYLQEIQGCLNNIHESVGLDSVAALDLTAESLDICPLHPNSNLPKFQFKCKYDEPLSSSSGNLEKLISFGLCACTNLQSFSASICGLQCLQVLTLEGSIPEVPKDLGQLESLEEINLLLKRIKSLPDSICKLKHLKSLKLRSCFLLEQLPNDLGRLEGLVELYIEDCISLRDIPNSICNMKCLEYLHLSNCIQVEKLPKKLGRLKRLIEIDIRGTSISRLPQSIIQRAVFC